MLPQSQKLHQFDQVPIFTSSNLNSAKAEIANFWFLTELMWECRMLIMINIWCMLHEMKYICKIGQKKVSVIFRFWYNSSQMSNFKLQNFFEKSKPEIRKKGKMSDKKILLEIYPNIFFYFEIERRLFRLFLSDTNQ